MPFDSAVIGAGVFGSWIARTLARRGERVLLLDAWGPANSRASSGDESRIIRMGYGPDEIYTRMSARSLELWRELPGVFVPCGVLWLAREHDPIVGATLEVLARAGVPHQRLEGAELESRFPQFRLEPGAWAIFEPSSGALMARRGVQAVVESAVRSGAVYRTAAVTVRGAGVLTSEGERIDAGRYVFACGPWLPKLFPDLLGQRIFPTRQEVFYFGVPSATGWFGPDRMPAWVAPGQLYGIPDLEGRGFKIGDDAHGEPADPDTLDRLPTSGSLDRIRRRLAGLFPTLAGAPLLESRVCQYENSSNGDFLIDRHPEYPAFWLAGGGSGHGFKHGPAVAEYLAGQLAASSPSEIRFALATKNTRQARQVH